MNQSDRAQSEYHMAFSYLGRLNNLFYICDEAAMGLDPSTWFHGLLAIFRELSTEMKDEEKEKYKQRKNEINSLVQNQNRNNSQSGYNSISSDLYDKLHDFEMDLRKVLDDAGLQKKMIDDPSRALR